MNQTILITGASSGFGLACAELFASKGWQLIIAGRRLQRLLKFKDRFPHVQIHCVQLDVRDRLQVKELVPCLPLEFQAIDVLCNNAGLALGTAVCTG